MNDKTYEMDGKHFRLKDLTLDEADEVNNLFQVSGNSIEVSNENSKKFLSLVLEPIGSSQASLVTTPGHPAFGGMKESTALEVLKDFFSGRITNQQKLKEYFSTLAAKQN